MAPSKVQNLTAGGSGATLGTATTTGSFTGPVYPQVGDTVIVHGSRDNAGSEAANGSLTTITVTDTVGNVYTRVRERNTATTSAGAGVVSYLFYSKLTVAWSSGTTVMATHASQSVAGRTIRAEHWADLGPLRVSSDNAFSGTAGGAVTLATGAASPLAGDLVFAVGAAEYGSVAAPTTSDTDTTNGSWSTIEYVANGTASITSGAKSFAQSKLVTADGAQTWNVSGYGATTSVEVSAIVAAFMPATSTLAAGAFVQTLGSASSPSTNTFTAVVVPASASPEVGDLVVISCARDNTNFDLGAGDSFADTAGNTWTAGTLASSSPASQGLGIVAYQVTSIITSAWTSNNTITWTHSSVAGRTMVVDHYHGPFTGLRASSRVETTVTNATGADLSVATGAGTPQTGDLVIVTGAAEWGSNAAPTTLDTDTTNGSWSSARYLGNGNASTSGVKVATQHKLVTGAGTQTADMGGWGGTTNVDVAGIIAAFTPTPTSPVVSGTARSAVGVTARATGAPVAVGTDPFSFTGVPDGALPFPWVASSGGTGAGAVIESERLKLTSGSSGGSYHGGRALYDVSTSGDMTRLVKLAFENPTVEQYCNLCLLMDTWVSTGDYPTNGYMVSLRPNGGGGTGEMIIAKVTSGGFAQMAGVGGLGLTAGVDVWLEASIVSGVVEGRVWAVGGTRPVTPTTNWTDPGTPIASGKWGVGMASGGASKRAWWDDFSGSGLSASAVAGSSRLAVGVTARAAGSRLTVGASRLAVGVTARAVGVHLGSVRVPVAVTGRATGSRLAAGTVRVPAGVTASAAGVAVGASTGTVSAAVGVTARATGGKFVAGSALVPVGVTARATAGKVQGSSVRVPVGVTALMAAAGQRFGTARAAVGVTARATGTRSAVGAVTVPVGVVPRLSASRVVFGSVAIPVGVTARLTSVIVPVAGTVRVAVGVVPRLSASRVVFGDVSIPVGVTARATATAGVVAGTALVPVGVTVRASGVKVAAGTVRVPVAVTAGAVGAHLGAARAAVGVTARAVGVRVASGAAVLPVGATVRAQGTMVAVGAARLPAGVTARAVGIHLGTTTVPVGVGVRALGVKLAAGTTRATVGVTARATAAKMVAGTVRAFAGATLIVSAGIIPRPGLVRAVVAVTARAAGSKTRVGALVAPVAVTARAVGSRTATAGAVRVPVGVTATVSAVAATSGAVRVPVGVSGRATGGRVTPGAVRAVVGLTGWATGVHVAVGAALVPAGVTASVGGMHVGVGAALVPAGVHARAAGAKATTGFTRAALGVNLTVAATKTAPGAVRVSVGVTGTADQFLPPDWTYAERTSGRRPSPVTSARRPDPSTSARRPDNTTSARRRASVG